MADMTALFNLQGVEQSGQMEISPAPQLQRLADSATAREQQVTAIYRTYQENGKLSEELQAKLLKGLFQGEEVFTLLDIALECIGRMTNNNLFTKQSQESLYQMIEKNLSEREGQWLRLENMKKSLEEQSQGEDNPFIKELEQVQEYLTAK